MIVQLRSEDQKVLEDWTGCIPILLQELVSTDKPREVPEIPHGRNTGVPAIGIPGPSRAVLPHKPRSSSPRAPPVVHTEGSPGASDDPEATYRRLTEELLEWLRCSEAADIMKGSISRFYGYYKHELKGPQPGIWNE